MIDRHIRIAAELGLRTYTVSKRQVGWLGNELHRESEDFNHVTLPFVSILSDKYRPEEWI